MAILDLSALRQATVVREPFEHVVLPGFVASGELAAIERDFPAIDMPGSIPASELRFGPAFASLLAALEGPELRAVMAEKFATDLAGRPTLVTVRGQVRAKDGRIHTDSKDKLITVLLYLNRDWAVDGGRLRLLRSPGNLEDFLVEVPPVGGTMLAFRCRANAWHGHKPFAGARRTIQLNWVESERVVRRELFRHRLSARVKKLRRLIGRAIAAAGPRPALTNGS